MKPKALLIFGLTLAAMGFSPVRTEATPLFGDSDADADIDLADVARFVNCFSGQWFSEPEACFVFNLAPGLPIVLEDYALFSCGLTSPGVAVDAVIVDPPVSPTASGNVVLTGVTSGALRVQVTGGAQSVIAETNGCQFSLQVPLRSNAVNRLYVSAEFNGGEVSAPTAVAVTQDSQAPSLFVDFPVAGAQITAVTTDVAGRVSDALSGFDDLRVTVAVNGGPPVLAIIDIGVGGNGTYIVSGVPLNLGPNTIKVSAVDALSNFTERTIQVTSLDPPAGAAIMEVFSGNTQSAAIRAPLPSPIQVRLLSGKGTPLEGKLVQFNVVRSDGRLASQSSGLFPGKISLQAFTNANGVARAFWRMGSDAGRGNNRVEVVSDSVVGTTVFCASATAGPASQINVGAGNNQKSEAGAPAPEVLDVWINDACNPVPGLEVTFSVRQGGGKIEGQDIVTRPTDMTGHASVNFTLGTAAGNNVVEATFVGNPNPPAVFTLVGVSRDATIPTSFQGLVLDNAGQPIQNATCALIINGITLPFVRSDLNGEFSFDNFAQSGAAELHVSGASATHIGGAGGVDIPLNSFPSLRYTALIVPNARNSLPTPVLLPRSDPANTKLYSRTQDTELTVAGMSGLKMVVKAGSMKIRSGGQFVPAPNGTLISLNQVHHDDVPMPLPDGAAPPFAWTLQPGGAQFDPPITVFYPNISGLPAGAIANFLSFNHDTGKFEIIATGHVTQDGTTIVTDPGAGIGVAGWGCNCPPYAVTGQCCHCNAPCQTCVVGACVPTGNGIPCGSTCCAAGQSCCEGTCCDAGQGCCNGSCAPPDQTCCDDGHTCPPDETCCQTGCCLEGEECCENGCCRADEQCCGDRCISALNICCDNNVECFPEFPMCCGQSCCVADGQCCDDECQIPGSQCCFPGKVCSPPTPRCCGETCCAAGVECCDGVCAAPGAHCCDDANFCSGDTPQCCVETCCAADGVCCRGECQPSGTACCEEGNTCPPDTPICCHGTCCETGDICCEDGCSPPGSSCCGDQGCGPNEDCCGNTCCPSSQNCCNEQCQAPGVLCCPDGRTCPGTQPICCGINCCSPGSNCCGAGNCCAGDQVCCDGVCKPPGHVCCPGGASCPGSQPICCGNNCCTFGSVCCGESNCCSQSEVCCNGICQAPGTQCCPEGQKDCNGNCVPASNVCCPGGGSCPSGATDCCGASCCGAGHRCCEGQCVPVETDECCPDGGSNCDGVCIPPGSICCPGGSVCDSNEICCGPGCCAGNDLCCNNQCLAPGNICCPDGSDCPSSQPICCGINCCSPGSNCCGAGNCCAGDQVCCDGVCKPPGHVCCPGGASCPGSQPICCGTNCCTFGSVCCGTGNCCASTDVCCNGVCKPAGTPCP